MCLCGIGVHPDEGNAKEFFLGSDLESVALFLDRREEIDRNIKEQVRVLKSIRPKDQTGMGPKKEKFKEFLVDTNTKDPFLKEAQILNSLRFISRFEKNGQGANAQTFRNCLLKEVPEVQRIRVESLMGQSVSVARRNTEIILGSDEYVKEIDRLRMAVMDGDLLFQGDSMSKLNDLLEKVYGDRDERSRNRLTTLSEAMPYFAISNMVQEAWGLR